MFTESWLMEGVQNTIRAENPKQFLAQHLAPLFYNETESSRQAHDHEIMTEEQFWLGAPNQMFSVVHLREFFISNWFPRTPGVFWTERAKQARQYTYAGPSQYDPALGQYYLPQAKMALIEEGGIGTIRLQPKMIDNIRCWYGTAVKTDPCDAGIPLAIPEQVIGPLGVRWGDCVDIVGRIRFLRETGLEDVGSNVHGARPLILLVEAIRPAGPVGYGQLITIRPVVLFDRPCEGRYDESGPGYSFVQCQANSDDELDRAARWMERYAAKFNGKVLTNFDEQFPRLADAPLSYQRLVGKTYERTVVKQYFGDTVVYQIDQLQHREEVYMGPHISVGGNAIINIDSMLTNVTQTIGASQGLQAQQKAELDHLVQRIKTDIEPVKATHPEEVQAVADALQKATAQATKPPEERKKTMLQLSADGLISAAKTIKEVAPSVLSTAGLIAKFITGLGS